MGGGAGGFFNGKLCFSHWIEDEKPQSNRPAYQLIFVEGLLHAKCWPRHSTWLSSLNIHGSWGPGLLLCILHATRRQAWAVWERRLWSRCVNKHEKR